MTLRDRFLEVRNADWLPPLLVALLVWLTIVSSVTGGVSLAGGRPGYTLDEPFNVVPGIDMATALRKADLSGYRKACLTLVDHPPLGRIWLGMAHECSMDFAAFTGWKPPDNDIDTARIGSATAFALTILLVGWTAANWYGRFAGFSAAVCVMLMPRVFGHAHLAALESCVTLTYIAAILFVAQRWNGSAPTWKSALVGGLLLGFALLTKIQGAFLPPAVGLWALLAWRQKALLPLMVWSLTGLAVFCAGWPWLWTDTLVHLKEYFGRTTDRGVVLAWYFGQQFRDKEVPWHYPWVMFLTTVPLGIHLLSVWGCRCVLRLPPLPEHPAARKGANLKDVGTQREGEASAEPRMANPSSDSVLPSRLEKNGSRELLLAFAIVCPLVVFSLPRVAVYDGERLYLMVFPLWGIFAGRGASALWFAASLRLKWLGRGAILAVWGAALWGLVAVAPCYLSYYNLLTGGLPGAAWLGLPVTCWGDSLTPAFLEEVAQNLPPDSTLQVAPVMEPLSQVKLLSDTPAFREKRLKLVPWHTSDSPWVLVFQREDYLDPDFRLPPKHLPVCQLRRRGVLLAALYRVR